MVQKSDNLKDFSNNISAITGDILKKESERKNKYVIIVISLFIIVLILIYIFATKWFRNLQKEILIQNKKLF